MPCRLVWTALAFYSVPEVVLRGIVFKCCILLARVHLELFRSVETKKTAKVTLRTQRLRNVTYCFSYICPREVVPAD